MKYFRNESKKNTKLLTLTFIQQDEMRKKRTECETHNTSVSERSWDFHA